MCSSVCPGSRRNADPQYRYRHGGAGRTSQRYASSTFNLRFFNVSSRLTATPSSLSLPLLDAMRHSLQKCVQCDWLHEDGFVFSQHWTCREELVGISGKVEHFGFRVTVMKPPGQFVAAHPWHHHVNDKQVEPRLGDDKSKRVRSIARGHDFVTTTPQRSFGEVPNPFIVIYDQNAA
jgi:hypothetical protein